jgi:NAD(P)-dependent dehydrogenase (short-subunit alcohol dehydrogenase family)
MSNASPFSLAGRRALVTGASRGLGEAMARGLAVAGASVALVARSAARLESVRDDIGGDSVAAPFEIAGDADMAALVDTCEQGLGGPIDVVVHAAGIQHRQPASEFDPLEWARVLDVNLTAPFRLSQEVGRRQLSASRTGSHIFVGSLSSTLALPNVVAYTASKSAVYGVVRNLSLEWAGRGIRVNAIGPGYIRTELTESVFADPQRQAQLSQRIPAGRFGDPADMAGPVVFLASDASSYVTGQLLMVDGGWTGT